MLGINRIIISPAILRKISEIDEFKGLWKGLERHTTALQLLGEVADHGAQLQRILGPLEHQPIGYDVLDMINHAATKKHRDIPSFRLKAEPISYYQHDRLLGALQVPEAHMARALTEKLLKWVNTEINNQAMHPLLIAAVFMAVFLQTAPFAEKNEDTAIFAVILILLKTGYNYAPYVFLNKLVEDKKDMLFGALLDNQASLEAGAPRWEQWVLAFLTILQDQKEILTQRLYAKSAEMKHLPKLSARIMVLFKHHKRLQMKQIVALTRAKRPTIKLRLAELVEGGYIKRHGEGRATWYALD